MIFILLKTEGSATLGAVESESQNISELMMKGLMFSMSQGISDVGPFVEKVKDLKNLTELRVTPTNTIKKDSESQMDADELACIKSKLKTTTRRHLRVWMLSGLFNHFWLKKAVIVVMEQNPVIPLRLLV